MKKTCLQFDERVCLLLFVDIDFLQNKNTRCPSRPRHMYFFPVALRFALFPMRTPTLYTPPTHSTEHAPRSTACAIKSHFHKHPQTIIINYYSTPSWFPYTKCNSDQKSLQKKKKVSNKITYPTLQKYNLVTKFPDRNKSAISNHKHPQKSSCFQQTSTNIFLFSLQNVNF